MAHNIAVDADGRPMMAYTGKAPWHGLGTQVPGYAATARELMVAAGLDWLVSPVPTASVPVTLTDKDGKVRTNPDGTPLHIPSLQLEKYALVREDTLQVLAEGVTDSYTVLQNWELFAELDAAAQGGEAHWHTAGALDDGTLIWALGELPQKLVVRNGSRTDEYVRYFLSVNSHIPGFAHRMAKTKVRVVCENTMFEALQGAQAGDMVNIAHMPNIRDRIEAARIQFGLIAKQDSLLADTFQAMVNHRMDKTEASALFQYAWKMPDGISAGAEARRSQTRQLWTLADNLFEAAGPIQLASGQYMGMGLDFAPGTLYTAVNVVTDLVTHKVGRRDSEAHLDYMVRGDGLRIESRAMEFARHLLK